MEDHRSEFGIIVAGYTQNMEHFLQSNPGLKSRFDRSFLFEDFTESELLEIAVSMFNNKGLKADAQAEKHLKKHIASLYSNRDRFFGNARSIRKIVEKAIRSQELRMADLSKEERTEKMMKTITIDDVKKIQVDMDRPMKRKPLGFKLG